MTVPSGAGQRNVRGRDRQEAALEGERCEASCAAEGIRIPVPIEEHPDCRQVLLGGRRRVGAVMKLDVRRHVVRADCTELVDVPGLEPAEEAADVPVVRRPGVAVADVRGEEL